MGGELQILLADLKACSTTRNLERGKQVHAEAADCGHDSSIYVASALINMYGKCGSMGDARGVFDSLKYPNVVAWNALIMGYAENGQGLAALDLFTKLINGGPSPDYVTFMAALKACTSLTDQERWDECRQRGREIHNLAAEKGCLSHIYVQNTLIDMYCKCGSMVEAHMVFDSMEHPTVVSWNALILGYADTGESLTALNLFMRLKGGVLAPNAITFVAALKACTALAVKDGYWQECSHLCKAMHNLAAESGCISNIYVQNTWIDMYSKCGRVLDARQVFESIKNPTVVSWNALILGYADNGEGLTALELFTRMKVEGPPADSVTIVAALRACISFVLNDRARCRDCGKVVHRLAIEYDCTSSIYVQSTLIDMYAKCGSMLDAWQVFDTIKLPNLVCWTALIVGYTETGEGLTALTFFTRMIREGHVPDPATFVAALKACTSLIVTEGWTECRNWGNALYNLALANGCNSDTYVQNILVDMYAKCASMVDARHVFDSMKHRTVVSWNTLILGYADNGKGLVSLELFRRMKNDGPPRDSVTFAGVLKASVSLGALEFGRTVHSEIGEKDIDKALVTCLVDFYAKCGSLLEAQDVFDLHPETRDVITWNALLAGFSSCGDVESAFRIFQGMQDAGFKPNSVTLLSILTCCSHAGLVDRGKEFFEAMSTKYGVLSCVNHYNCMVDLFGRANKLDDAMALLERMPCSPDDVSWRTVLGACRKWKNLGIGRLAFQCLKRLNRSDVHDYVIMGQIYGSIGMLQEQEMLMKNY